MSRRRQYRSENPRILASPVTQIVGERHRQEHFHRAFGVLGGHDPVLFSQPDAGVADE